MTLDEVKTLSEEELQIKAAELMGWEDVAIREVDNLLNLEVKFEVICGKPDSGIEDPEWLVGDGEHVFAAIPDYPNDIAAAWKLCHSLPDDSGVCLHTNEQLSDQTRGSRIDVWAHLTTKNVPDLLGQFEGDGTDDPRLLTRAYVLAMT